ncbi:unnamed protein product [Durusdinium trenchii]|uniref:ASCH domain-containing protein n=1 Tax=Durusdinium trenchii TaxID=1381693 RepID=A0ABP0HE39_9DINO
MSEPTHEAHEVFKRNAARVPFLDFAPDFIDPILSGDKKATTRCPGPKDTDHTSDLEAVQSQGWALATCGSTRGFGLLCINQVEQRSVTAIDDALAKEEGLETGEELQRVLRRFYPDLTDDDTVTVLHFNLMKAIREP